jgi:hypothetical protein
LDFAVGPMKYSGLFTLLKDFGLAEKAGARYTIEGWNGGDSFYKKDFIPLVVADEENSINTFQALLEAEEIKMRKAKLSVQVNDLSEIDEEEIDEYDTEGMLSAIEKDVEG